MNRPDNSSKVEELVRKSMQNSLNINKNVDLLTKSINLLIL